MTHQAEKIVEPTKVLFEGRYRKLVRDLPQTIFYCPKCKGRGCEHCEGFGKLTKDSVQELIARVAMPWLKSRRNKFHGAGREDMDVRMLGEGRPFVFEALKCKRPMIDLEELCTEINRRNEGRIEVLNFKFCNRKRVVELKETRCPKDYLARVRMGGEIDSIAIEGKLKNLVEEGRLAIFQTTPSRVAHRRANLERERWIEILNFERDANDWLVTIRSAHGTYIKEVVSGESGRTQPSLSKLLDCPCSCVELDVLNILPPELETPHTTPDSLGD
ncbi:MAG TPA: tRNA pseudouridine(54/55) synthase Pus10 [Planctomycetota bacterium]|jgi:tRNA pseudouridine synthase 10|nr:hypothetical protein [Planctomycetota bacterium]MDP6128552.1 tRNA pseudouridine(54/55) synthase Pus10 [Planctomycetota bacterium]MDP7245526.1 tRNA pseudouridine(54/55) synthase Pus10 [Planctomycetota bacterium]HJM38698.1 tRNA pseudouridine(54/55) synthase Pus10 [Planctomycetota bacterium]|tara:strand:+ start:14475 stop:15296 length:822 start_codon:yes stop_codon:yes gene_type:complete